MQKMQAALGEQEGFLSGSWIYGNINYKNGMSNATPVVGFIDKNIPGCKIFPLFLLEFMSERTCIGDTIHLSQIAMKGLVVVPAGVMHHLSLE
jgi:hypothetical protein